MSKPWPNSQPLREQYYAPDLSIQDEPLLLSLLRYRRDSRWSVGFQPGAGNLVSSRTSRGTQMPVLDLDFDHLVVESSTEGHHHLFINVEMSYVKWAVLMLVLWWTGVIEMGNAVWSLRRGANFVRNPGTKKVPGPETTKPRYGWLFPLRRQPHDEQHP